MSAKKLTHIDDQGRARMVDVAGKQVTRRVAVACGRVLFNENAFEQLRHNRLAKGDALAVARLAGIQAAKRTAEWIPLCHGVPLEHVQVDFEFDEAERSIRVTGSAAATWTTGVEMEALVAVSAAALALNDRAKAVDRGIRITEIQLLSKEGGRSGSWQRI